MAETTAGGATGKLRAATPQSLEEKTNPNSRTRWDLLSVDEHQEARRVAAKASKPSSAALTLAAPRCHHPHCPLSVNMGIITSPDHN